VLLASLAGDCAKGGNELPIVDAKSQQTRL
jgi:hypothetical protein